MIPRTLNSVCSDSTAVRTLRRVPERLVADDRGVSHVLGVILVVAIVLTGIVSIVGFGVTGIADSTAEVSDTAVERDLTRFAQAVDRAAVHSDSAAGATTVDLSLAEIAESREWVEADGDAGRLSLSAQAGGNTTELVNTSLGLLEYENPRSEARIAYQSGLVFSAPDAGATPAVIRTNDFAYRTDEGVGSLTLHIIHLSGQALLDQTLELSAGATENLFQPVVLGAGDGPNADTLRLQVDSAYSAGWELALREVFPADRTAFTHNGSELEVVYDVPDEGLFLHAYHHEVALDGR